jgi:hypothetical protein
MRSNILLQIWILSISIFSCQQEGSSLSKFIKHLKGKSFMIVILHFNGVISTNCAGTKGIGGGSNPPSSKLLP